MVIAVRYAAVRRQFCSGSDGAEESPVLEYQLQTWRLLPYLASSYVLKIFSDYFSKTLSEFQFKSILKTDDQATMAEMGIEIHALSSAGKPVAGWTARDAIQEGREACGGHGYLKVSGFGSLRNDNDANCTYEGDNNVLLQQASNWLLKVYDDVQNSKSRRPIQTPLGSANFLSDIDKILSSSKFEPSSPKDATEPKALLAAYKWLCCWLVKSTADRVKCFQREGKNLFECKNESQVFYARTLSIAYVEHFALQHFLNWVQETAMETTARNVLLKVSSLYGAWCLEKHLSTLYIGGLIKNPETGLKLREGILQLCSSLKNEAVGLADVLAPPDFILNSALGHSNGQVYNNLQGAIMQGSKAMERPTWWQEIVSQTSHSKL